MAIRNVIKAKSYSRISSLIYEYGLIQKVELVCYETAPTKTFKELLTLETVTVNGEEIQQYPVDSTAIIHTFSFYGDEFETLQIDLSKSMHSQIYTHLLKIKLFEGCISDE